MNQIRFLLGVGISVSSIASTSLAAGPLGVPGPYLTTSRPGSVQTCPTDCEIVVNVVKDAGNNCEARVDVETVRVRKNKKFIWVIKKDPSDTNTYSFVRDGIAWVDANGAPTAPPDATEITPDKPHSAGKVKWKTGWKKTAGEYNYVVVVEGPKGNCKAPDPKIANDG